MTADRRLLLVHAHPDDEAIATGATMAHYAASGAHVTLVTCTRGEEGEVVVEDLAHLASQHQNELGEHRVGELAEGLKILGVTDHHYLGGVGRYRDSGMMGEPTNDHPDAFWQADIKEAARDLVRIIREVKPQVVITYDENGAYGHPDHIRAHDVTVEAIDRAAEADYAPELGAPWQVAKLYYNVVSQSMLQQGIDEMRAQGKELFADIEKASDLPFAVPDEEIAAEIDARDQLAKKFAALRAHRSQIKSDDPFFSLEDDPERQWGREHYVLARGERGPGAGPHGWEDDLFAGID
jgi:N-acetyl-1-D-myo-inositol-2-amino-2-deoxy-alpha-D-glucopyranoside deacetylase